jgi:hypothetical protein
MAGHGMPPSPGYAMTAFQAQSEPQQNPLWRLLVATNLGTNLVVLAEPASSVQDLKGEPFASTMLSQATKCCYAAAPCTRLCAAKSTPSRSAFCTAIMSSAPAQQCNEWLFYCIPGTIEEEHSSQRPDLGTVRCLDVGLEALVNGQRRIYTMDARHTLLGAGSLWDSGYAHIFHKAQDTQYLVCVPALQTCCA